MDSLPRPVLTVWARSGDPGGGSTGPALALRVRNAAEGRIAAMPEGERPGRAEARRSVDALVDAVSTRGGHRTVVAAVSLVDGERPRTEVHGFAVDLPLGTPSLEAEAHVGPTWLDPLDLALSQSLRMVAVHPYEDGVDVYEYFMGEAARTASYDLSTVPGAFDRLPRSKPVHPAPTADRGGSSYDDAAAHRSAWRDREYAEIANELGAQLDERAVEAVVVFGAPKAREAFERLATRRLEDRILRGGGRDLPQGVSDERRLLEALGDLVTEQVHTRAAERLALIAERGVMGLPAVLDAVQRGKLDTVVVPWDLRAQVYVEQRTGAVADTPGQARMRSAADEPRVMPAPARETLVELARAHATRVEFVRTGASPSPFDEVQGVAGLPRWT